MTPEVLEKVHQQMLMIMDDIHRVCLKNNLKYYMIGGTALGAIRHGGFIPWDPDIDIAMPREDYDRFLELAPKELDSSLFCHHYKVDKDYYPPHAIVEKKNTLLRIKNDDINDALRPQGIYVDVLPLDYVPDDEESQQRQAVDLIKIKKLKYRKQAKIYSSDSFVKRFVKKIFSLLYAHLSWYQLNEKQESIMKRHNNTSSRKYICSMASHYTYKKLSMKIEIWGEPKLYSFEGRAYMGPNQIEIYLTNLFGDYMRLPSKESQDELLSLYVNAEF